MLFFDNIVVYFIIYDGSVNKVKDTASQVIQSIMLRKRTSVKNLKVKAINVNVAYGKCTFMNPKDGSFVY